MVRNPAVSTAVDDWADLSYSQLCSMARESRESIVEAEGAIKYSAFFLLLLRGELCTHHSVPRGFPSLSRPRAVQASID